jgi:prepilin signal peptidase PulO-like enzyme (type II secretory pathway)
MKIMSWMEFLLIILPLIALLAGLTMHELRTDLIPNVITLPAAIYFLVVRLFVASVPWWQYLVGSLAMLAFCCILQLAIIFTFEVEGIGGGAIKLLAVVGSALGINLAIQVSVTLMVLAIIALSIGRFRKEISSSIFILLAVLLVLAWNFRSALAAWA